MTRLYVTDLRMSSSIRDRPTHCLDCARLPTMVPATPAELRAALREHMRALAVAGGRKGGKARAAKLTAAERSASARQAVQARWAKAKKRKKKAR